MKEDMKDSIVHYGVGSLPKQQNQRGVSVSCATRVDWPCQLAPVSKLSVGVRNPSLETWQEHHAGVQKLPVKSRDS